jgi:hypothetical protein
MFVDMRAEVPTKIRITRKCRPPEPAQRQYDRQIYLSPRRAESMEESTRFLRSCLRSLATPR